MNPIVPIASLVLTASLLAVALVAQAVRRRAVGGAAAAAAAARDLLLTRCDDAIVVVDPAGRVVERNDAAAALFGEVAEPARGRDGDRFAERYPWLVALGQGEGGDARADDEPRTWRVDGRTYAFRSIALSDPHGHDLGAVLRLRDVTRHLEVDELLRSMATTDDVTGVPTRRQFLDLAGRDVAHAARYGRPISLLLFDLDGFEGVVARHGHALAESLLRAVAATVVADLRAADVVGRIGGARFAVLLPEAGTVEAGHVAARVRREVARIEVPAPEAAVAATASLGVCSVGRDGPHDLEHLLACATEGLRIAQGRGGDAAEAHPGAWLGQDAPSTPQAV